MSLPPLHGITIVDFTRVMSEPVLHHAARRHGGSRHQNRRPGRGDDTRAWGPPFVERESTYFLSINRNKESLSLDLKTTAARAIVLTLLERADVLVENFTPGAIDALGFGYEAMSAAFPRLIFCSISGFGQSGPRREDRRGRLAPGRARERGGELGQQRDQVLLIGRGKACCGRAEPFRTSAFRSRTRVRPFSVSVSRTAVDGGSGARSTSPCSTSASTARLAVGGLTPSRSARSFNRIGPRVDRLEEGDPLGRGQRRWSSVEPPAQPAESPDDAAEHVEQPRLGALWPAIR